MPSPIPPLLSGGNASVYVTDMDRAVRFYTESLGFPLKVRIANEWAEIDAGDGLIIGLHIANPPGTVPAGTRGAINIELKAVRPLEEVKEVLGSRGVTFDGEIINYENVRLLTVLDPDGNAIILAQVLHSET
ncbi:VOC family protein [Haloferula luteola]|nr:VOC family protein [Haloferula luteola]